ncbi:MAG: type II toxin-antitoxin system VapC family toxin [Devosia sp.]
MLVIDASAALQWVFKDEASRGADDLFERVATSGATVPALFHAEFANVLVQAERRKRITADYAAERIGVVAALGLVIDFESVGRAWHETLALARAESLTVYDAAYLELAMRLGLSLATLDQDLAAAARRRGVEILP